MKKGEIYKLKLALKKAKRLEDESSVQREKLANMIKGYTGVVGFVDHLTGDGFGFTPESNNDTHVLVDEIIEWASNGEEITEELILDRLVY